MTLLNKVNFRPPIGFVPGQRKKNKKGKGGLNQGPWDTASIYNQLTPELFHSVIHLINQDI